ncbi:MAG TPA: DUF2252 family protein [Chroococcales cyanobacterium]|jgi:uncharacterized protein (DUF2252 family)
MKRAFFPVILLFLSGCGLNLSPAAAQNSTGLFSALGKGRDPVAVIRVYDAPVAKRDPELLQQKYQKMKESAFSFFRGSAHLYYLDASQRVEWKKSPVIPIQGDLHLENLGTFQAGNGALSYDLNDFDEAVLAPYTWEVARCAVSIRLAAHEAGFKPSGLTEIFLKSYLHQLERLAGAPGELSHSIEDRALSGAALKALDAAKSALRSAFMANLASGGHFLFGKKLQQVDPKMRPLVLEAVSAYAAKRREGVDFFKVKDLASRVAGTASVGRYRFEVLIEGKGPGEKDDLILEIKEEAASAAAPFASSPSGNQAERVFRAYDYFLPSPDAFLGIARLAGCDFLVREWQPAKGAVDLAELKSEQSFQNFLDTVALAAARAHARSGKARQILADAGKPSDFVRLIGDFADQYEEVVKQDYRAFKNSL